MKKTLKIAGIALSVFVALNLLIACVLQIYFTSHKHELIQKASHEIGNRIMASVSVKDAEISWFGTFPYLSIALKDVKIVDSASNKAQMPFLETSQFFVSFDMIKMIKGKFHINRVLLSNGIINFTRDSAGNSNLHILDSKFASKEPPKSPDQTLFNFMGLKNIRIYLSDMSEHKKYDLVINHLDCNADFDDTATCFKIGMKMHVNYLGLNTIQGYYGKNKDLSGSFQLYLNSKNQILTVPKIKLYLNDDAVIADGIFHLDTAKHFNLHLSAKKVNFENARTALLDTTQVSLVNFKLAKPIDIEIDMHGDTKYKSIPHVNLNWVVKDNELTTPIGKFAHCFMSGNFINDVNPNMIRNDTNSRMTITDFAGLWNETSQIHSGKITATDLTNPMLHFDLQAFCNLTDIDSLVQSNAVNLEEGKAKIDIVFDGAADMSRHVVPDITGSVVLSNAQIRYVPRNMKLVNCNAMIGFHHTAVSIDNLTGKLGNSSVAINGKIKSLAPLFAKTQQEMLLQWDIASPLIDLTQLVPLISGKNKEKRSKKSSMKALTGLSYAIDSFAEKCDIRANFNVKKIVYKKFEAENLNADLALNNRTGWKVNNIELSHASGKIILKGDVTQSNNENHFVNLDVKLNSVDVTKIFFEFDNFGMTSFNYKNLKGQVSLTAALQLELDNKAAIVPNTLKGDAEFRLVNGELIDFKPIEEICAKIFPNRNFRDIQFAELKDKFTVSNYKCKIDKMEIASNLVRMYVEGTYAIKGNSTNLLIQVPVSNLTKPDPDVAPDNKGLHAKNGLSVFIKAVDDGNGTIKFNYSLTGKHKKEDKKISIEE